MSNKKLLDGVHFREALVFRLWFLYLVTESDIAYDLTYILMFWNAKMLVPESVYTINNILLFWNDSFNGFSYYFEISLNLQERKYFLSYLDSGPLG